MLLLSNNDVEQVLSMQSCLDALDLGYQDMATNNATYRPRSGVIVPTTPSKQFPNARYTFGSMEGASRSAGVLAIRMKSDIAYNQDGRHLKYCIQPGTYCGLVMLFSLNDGEPLAIMPDGIIQHMRVGACAAIGVKHLSREDSSIVGILGSGGMARTYLEAFALVRPIQQAFVYSPNQAHREEYAVEMSRLLNFPVEPLNDPKKVVAGSDIVATCTDADHYIMTDPSWISDGMHLTDAGQGEWDPAVIERADVRIRLGRATFQTPEPGTTRIGPMEAFVAGQPEELGCLPEPRPEEPIGSDSYPLLTDLMMGRVPGRVSPKQVTFFDNQGSQGLQFAAVGGRVYQLAHEAGIGRDLPTEWFTQNIRD